MEDKVSFTVYAPWVMKGEGSSMFIRLLLVKGSISFRIYEL